MAPPNVELFPAEVEQQAVLANLLELYAHDFNDFQHLELGPDGRFGYQHLPLYWLEAERHPFLIKVGGRLAGFALVKKGSEISGNPAVWDLAEFFVVRGERRRGIGSEAARQVWLRFPGSWEVRVMESNQPACRFWQNAIDQFVGKPVSPLRVERSNRFWQLFCFESRADS